LRRVDAGRPIEAPPRHLHSRDAATYAHGR
jgi:hypothetical protein